MKRTQISKIVLIILKGLAAVALMITTANVASACWYVLGQDELPEGAERLRKF